MRDIDYRHYLLIWASSRKKHAFNSILGTCTGPVGQSPGKIEEDDRQEIHLFGHNLLASVGWIQFLAAIVLRSLLLLKHMASVQIHNVSHITISPSPAHGKDPLLLLPLSFFDAIWITLPPIQRLLLFPGATPDLHSLKSSLSTSLPLLYSLAGKLTYLPATGDIAVACSPDDHVTFIEAKSDGDFIRLASDEIHDVDSFLRLVPELDDPHPTLDTRVLPAPVMAVQVTKFESGGFAVGVAVHHSMVDGRGLWQFIEAWATACREAEKSEVSAVIHDRTVIRHHPRGDEIARRILKMMAPELPINLSLKHKNQIISEKLNIEEGRSELMRRTFTISRDMIQSIKQRANEVGNLQHSTFTVLSSLTWISLIKTKTIEDANEETILGFIMDCRTRLNPPLKDNYLGNCLKLCCAKAKVMELVGNAGLSKACTRIKEQIDESSKDVLGGCEDWVGEIKRNAKSVNVLIAGSSSFRAYEIDFGVGCPSRTELVSMNHEGQVVLVGGRKQGEIQMSVCLSTSHMEEFTKEFSRELCV
ncbi:anthocyanin 5-aromatic acyltransferase-like [Dioscorea cayenensis subsp. rotundata]|uniref:Anthocyanin 5-aromatic acyltransferase-like n=1 Tax=Dioscorea cayennensis subsp. rotundata TaxID=55577 RepID=A0AB40B8T7_DIOCR|nr:anthocyanin 5-aromatic acyltransferase-like [Dioscorea cayenensis subsp. rotundata]